MSEEYAFSFTPGSGHSELGKLVALQIEGSGSLIDNLIFSDSMVTSGIMFMVK